MDMINFPKNKDDREKLIGKFVEFLIGEKAAKGRIQDVIGVNVKISNEWIYGNAILKYRII